MLERAVEVGSTFEAVAATRGERCRAGAAAVRQASMADLTVVLVDDHPMNAPVCDSVPSRCWAARP
jgi:hypothetical protein